MTPEERKIADDFGKLFYEHWNKYERNWLGVHIIKYPTDLFIYQMMLYDNKPDFLIETGTYRGGGTLFFASMFDLIGHGQVVTVDKRLIKGRPKHDRITYITGPSTDTNTLKTVKDKIGNGSCMVVLDSNHGCGFVKRELRYYSKFVTPGQYLIADACYLNGHPIKPDYGPGPYEAVQWFMNNTKDFIVDPIEERYMITKNPGGFLRRKNNGV